MTASPITPDRITGADAALVLRAGEPFVLHIALRDAAGAPQLLSGRNFVLLIAPVGATTATIRAPATLSGDALYAIVTLTGAQTAALHADFAARALAYAIIEMIADTEVTRGAGSLCVAASAAIPSDGDPAMIDLPYVLAIPSPAGLLITETGARGLSAAEQFAIGGLDDGDPLTNAMFAALGEVAVTAADAANAAAENAGEKAALAQGVVDAQAANLEAIAAAREATAADREQTNFDQLQTGRDRLQTAADVESTVNNKMATEAAVLASGIARGQAESFAQDAINAAGAAQAAITLYPSTIAGISGVAEGEYFSVASGPGGNIYTTLYRKLAGDAVYINDFASYSAMSAALYAFSTSVSQNISDGAGFVRIDKYGGVLEEVSGTGKARSTPYGGIVHDSGVFRVLFEETQPDNSTFTIQKLSDSKIKIGAIGTYITVDPVLNTITVPGLDLGNVIGGVTFSTLAGVTSLTNTMGGTIALGSDALTGQIGALEVATSVGGVMRTDRCGGVIDEDHLDGTYDLCGGFRFDAKLGKLYDPDGNQIAPCGNSSENFSSNYIAEKNKEAEIHAEILRFRLVNPLKIAKLMNQYSVFVSYGQSNSCGTECFPTNYPRDDRLFGRNLGCLMLGDSVHGRSSTGSWVQCGLAALNPMTATVRDQTISGKLLTKSEIDALSPTAGNIGQTILETALATFSFLRLSHLGLPSDNRRYINYAVGVGGKTATELSKGASGGFYNRLVDGAAIAKTLVDAAAGVGQVGAAAIINVQGEDDGGAGTDPTIWKETWRRIRVDHHADVSVGIFGRDEAMVPMFTLQIGGQSCTSPGGFALANAQLEMALEDTGYFLIGGTRAARKGLHYGTNATAWNGMRIGKKMFELFCLNKIPFPFSPYEIETKGNQMLVTFLVPTPPIKFLPTYVGYVSVDAEDTMHKGFYPSDETGDLSVLNVAIAGSSSIIITCNRKSGLSPHLDYVRRTNPLLGTGNLFDSSDFQLLDGAYTVGSSWRFEESSVFYANQHFPGEEDLLIFSRSAVAI